MNRAILVKSCQRFRARQEAIEATWVGSLRAHPIRTWIVEGGHRYYPTTVRGLVFAVNGAIKIDGYDTYNDNSVKLRASLQYMLRAWDHWSHLFICDDDTFIHPARWLAHEPQGECEGRLYHPTPEQAKRHGEAPWLHGGAGWWMSRRLCELYVEHCHERTSGDDIVAARIAQQHGIEIHDRPDLYGDSRYGPKVMVCQPQYEAKARELIEATERPSAGNALITCHPVQPAEMVKLWEATREL